MIGDVMGLSDVTGMCGGWVIIGDVRRLSDDGGN